MQRALIVIVMLALVVTALAAGTLAAHWPYWQRAWQWHSAAPGWPEKLGGPTRTLQPAATPAQLTIDTEPLAQRAGTSVLMVADATGHTRAYFTAGMDERSSIDGRELSVALQVVLFGALMQEGRARLLDEPLGNLLAQWKNDPRGVITPRQLFWQLSGLAGGPLRPLNPFSPLSQLASGPDFRRAVFRTPLRYPPGSHFAPSLANAQLLGLVAAQLRGEGYATVLERLVWSRLAAQPATGLLDHRRGEMSAYCCFSASAGDWLRLGLLLANSSRNPNQQILPQDYLAQVETASPVNPGRGLGFELVKADTGRQLLQLATTGRRLLLAPDSGAALFWAGTGEPPAGLAALLL